LGLLDEVIAVFSDEAIHYTRLLARQEGLLCGISSGAAVLAASNLAHQDRFQKKTIVVLLPDAGERYLSSALFEGIAG
jgi:cysteine synthase A